MKIESCIFLFLLSVTIVSGQVNTNRLYAVKDIAKNNDFVTFISPNSSQDVFNIKSNLTQSEYLTFELYDVNGKLPNHKKNIKH